MIFCRNAFIYFSVGSRPEDGRHLRLADAAPGYLCVGASESLLNITNAFALEEIDGAFVYAKQ